MVKSYVDRKEFKFLENRKKFLLVALCVICLGVLFNIFRGVKLDIKFTGGAMLKYSYSLDESVSESDVSASDFMKLDKAEFLHHPGPERHLRGRREGRREEHRDRFHER